MKTIFITSIDLFFTFIASFLFAFIIAYYYLERTVAITVSVIIAVLFCFIYLKIKLQRKNKTNIKNNEKFLFEQTISQLCLYTESEQCALFEKALTVKEYKCEKRKNGVVIKNKNAVVFPLFSFDGVTKTDVVRIFNALKSKEIAYILSKDFSPEISDFIQRFDGRIVAVNGETAYEFLKQTETLPCVKFEFQKPKPLTLAAFKNLLSKTKAKNFLVFGLIFLLSSYFVPMKTYYLICGGIFLLLFLFVTLFGETKTPESVKK